MADQGFNAGSVFVELGAQISKFKKDMAEARGTLDEFATAAQGASKRLEGGVGSSMVVFDQIQNKSRQAAIAFGDFGKQVAQQTINLQQNTQNFNQQINTVLNQTTNVVNRLPTPQTVDRTARSLAGAAGKIISVQIALAALAGQAGDGLLGDSLRALSNGVQVAAASMSLAQGKISAYGAGLIALGVAITSFVVRSMEDQIKATDASTAASIRARLAMTQLSDAIADASKSQAVFGATGLAVAQNKLQTMQGIFESNLKRLREIPEEIAAIQQKLSKAQGLSAFFLPGTVVNTSEIKALEDQISGLKTERTNRLRTNADISRDAAAARLDVALKQINEDATKATKAFVDLEAFGKKALEVGIAEPAEIGEARLKAAKTRLEEILREEVKLEALLNSPGLSEKGRQDILNQISSLSRGKGSALSIIEHENELSEIEKQNKKIADADIKALNERKRMFDEFAGGFSSALGAGIDAAILGGAKPLEALARTGEAFFSNMLNKSLESFSKGLSSVLQGTGLGEAGVGALTGILGIGGAVLSRLGSKSSGSFGNVKSTITSSEQTRGIIAGPANIAIAAVGENLQRAMIPVVDRLDIVVNLLIGVERNTRGGGTPGTSGKSTPSPRVPTDFA